jgi:hypothetical protein
LLTLVDSARALSPQSLNSFANAFRLNLRRSSRYAQLKLRFGLGEAVALLLVNHRLTNRENDCDPIHRRLLVKQPATAYVAAKPF